MTAGRPTVTPADVHSIHLIAIGGVGMAALAGMFKQRGYDVRGSDEAIYPPMSDVLARLGLEVRSGYRAENLQPAPDLVVVGNKVSRTNPEVEALLTSGLPYLSFPEALAEFFIAGHRSLVVAGTHGKTTSTAMLAWVLERAGRDPSVMVGGQSLDFGGNFKLGEGDLFVVEGDEYDSAFFDKGPKFLHYRPNALLLTAVEFDHADIYRDLAHVKSAFRQLMKLLPVGSPLVVSSEFPHAVDVAKDAPCRSTTFGANERAEWRIAGLADTGGVSRFSVVRNGREEGRLSLQGPGLINAINALGVYVLCREIGLAHEAIAAGLSTFSGVARRQELVGEFAGVTLIDDFAHHPTAVAGVISALRLRYPDRRLWAVFEPRSNTSRRKVFQREYVEAFCAADRVIIGEVMRKNTDAIPDTDLFSSEQLAEDLRAQGIEARSIADVGEIASLIAAEAESGDVVVMMSNGSFGGLRGVLDHHLRQRQKTLEAPRPPGMGQR
jgi:UDP-N-acetylmuramate: L-alanyl-gamma-D-glutamyl-meso-diaminopimelate ligase